MTVSIHLRPLSAIILALSIEHIVALRHLDMVRLEQLPRVPIHWQLLRRASPLTPVQLRIALHQQNVADFEKAVIDLSTPGHPTYRKHMKQHEVQAMLRPTDATINGVLGWLESEGVPDTDILHDNDWISFTVTVERAEKILNTEFSLYRSEVDEKVTKLRTLGYSVPKKLRKHIDLIQPTTHFGMVRTHVSEVSSPIRAPSRKGPVIRKSDRRSKWRGISSTGFDYAPCNVTQSVNETKLVTVECIRHLYRFPNVQPGQTAPKGPRSKLGITGFIQQFAQYADLAVFLEEYAPYAIGTNFSVRRVRGGRNDQGPGIGDPIEANLDTQLGVPLAYPLPVEFYTVGTFGSSEDGFLNFALFISALPDDELPHTITTSYGYEEKYIDPALARALCTIYAQLGARGVSLLFSSGDAGVGSVCYTVDGTNRTRFGPTFPGTCPFVTVVGGTFGMFPEQAWEYSQGGFSDLFPRPEYQKDAVGTYLKGLGSQWDGLFNPAGRAFPDISAQALRLYLIDEEEEFPVSGTSAASPIVASLIALMNDALIQNGLSALGFLNPWIYATGNSGGAWMDVVNGGSIGCTANDLNISGVVSPLIPFASWNATPGWDPVTGWGTPNFEKLLELAINGQTTPHPNYA